MALPPITGIALCAGVGMLDEGCRLAFEHLGFDYRTVAYVEREAFAASQLVALMETGCLDTAPVWSDLTTFDGKQWRGLVDCITAGFPCQPHSVAGKRDGLEDDRWIWPDIARLIGDVGPRFVLLENVPGLASTGGLGACLGDLAALGFDAEWGLLSAADVGASHTRERLFILAYARCEHEHVQQRLQRAPEHPGSGSELEDASWHERDGSHGESGSGRRVCEAGDELEYADGAGLGTGGERERGAPDDAQAGNSVDDARPTERRPQSFTRRGGESRGDRGRQAASGTGESVEELGNASRIGWGEGRPELCGQPGRSDIARTGSTVADPGSARPQGRELRRTRDSDGGGAGSTWIS